ARAEANPLGDGLALGLGPDHLQQPFADSPGRRLGTRAAATAEQPWQFAAAEQPLLPWVGQGLLERLDQDFNHLVLGHRSLVLCNSGPHAAIRTAIAREPWSSILGPLQQRGHQVQRKDTEGSSPNKG